MENIDIEEMIFKDPEEVTPRKGDLLIAEPLLKEPYFKRSAILILDEGDGDQHLGLTLNVPTPCTLQDLFPDWVQGSKVKVYSGGPVETDRLFMLHTLGDEFEGSTEIAPGLYIGADLDSVIEYVNKEGDVEGKIRFFLGYSGWSKDQLTTEILNHSWAVNKSPDMSEALTGQGDAYWRKEVERLGSKYRSWLLIPQDPEFN